MEAQCIGDIEKADNEVKLRVGQVYKPPARFSLVQSSARIN